MENRMVCQGSNVREFLLFAGESIGLMGLYLAFDWQTPHPLSTARATIEKNRRDPGQGGGEQRKRNEPKDSIKCEWRDT